MPTVANRACAWCRGPIPAGARRDAVTCSQSCRQARHRVARYASSAAGESSCGKARRIAYADPPYPGNSARIYGDHPDYAGEVDHGALLSQLAAYDAWALSTSAAALPELVVLAHQLGITHKVGSWHRGHRAHSTARYPVNAWEPVLYVPLPSREAGDPRRVDALVHGVSPMVTLPSRVVGAKPAAFVRWMLDLVGATPKDELDDLFPGSGIVGRVWELYSGRSTRQLGAGVHDTSDLTAVGIDS